MDFSRRTFLISASASAAMMALGACSRDGTPTNNALNGNTALPPANDTPEPAPGPATLDPTDHRGTLIGPGGRKNADGEMEYWLRFADLDQIEKYVTKETQPAFMLLPFFGHAVVPHPVDRKRAGVFAKWGTGGCEVDMVEKRILREIAPTPGREFYGHAAWSKDGKTLYAIESEPRLQGNYEGYVVVRDAATMNVQGEFPTFGKAPHDCHILDDGKTLAITNGGDPATESPGCVTFVDIQAQQLLERVEIPDLMAGHLAITGQSSKGDLAVGSTPHNPPGDDPEGFKKIPGGLTLRASGGKATRMTEPKDTTDKMLGETLSVVIHDELNVVGATNPAGNIVSFWNTKEGSFLKSFDLAEACGIALTLDKRYFVVTARQSYAVRLIRARDLALVESASFNLSGINGSHCVIYDL